MTLHLTEIFDKNKVDLLGYGAGGVDQLRWRVTPPRPYFITVYEPGGGPLHSVNL